MRPPVPRSTSSRRSITGSPLVGAVSRPSVNAWTNTRSPGTPWACANRSSASRCAKSLCTFPSPTSPITWSARGRPSSRDSLARAHAASSRGLRANSPLRTARVMRISSWSTMRPAPMFWCPTSLLPITGSPSSTGSPTSSPLVATRTCGHSRSNRSFTGVRAARVASPARCSGCGLVPQPSRTMSTQGALRGAAADFAVEFIAEVYECTQPCRGTLGDWPRILQGCPPERRMRTERPWRSATST